MSHGPLGERPTISVVVPTHGRVDLFRETLESLRRQTVSCFEVIVADDSAKRDDRAQVEDLVSKYRDATNREAHYVFSEPCLGQARNTNQGLAQARGGIARILHSDDILAPRALETEMVLVEDPRMRLDLLFHLVEPFRRAPRFDGDPELSLIQPSLLFRSVMHSSTPLPSATVFRRELLETVGGMREDLDFLCDWEFASRLIVAQHRRHRFIGMVSPGYVGWRLHDDSTTGRLWHRHFLEHEGFIRDLQARPRDLDELVGDRAAQRCFFALAIRYRYRRLWEDVANMRWGQLAKALPRIARCAASPTSVVERLTPAPWTLLGRLRDRPLVVKTGPDPLADRTPVVKLADPRRGIKSFLAAHLTRHIMRWAEGYSRRHRATDRPTRQRVAAGPDVLSLGSRIEVRPSLEQASRAGSDGSVRIHTEYNNTTNLSPLRELIGSAETVTVAHLNSNAFVEPVLQQCAKFIAVGGRLEVSIFDNQHLTAFGFKSVLDKICPGEFGWVGQVDEGVRTHVLRYRRRRPGPTWQSAPHTGWTFGMLTTGKRLANVARFIDSIEQHCREPYEILLVSPVDLGPLAERPGVRVLQFSELDDLGWITKKKNLIAEAASYSDILICHDRFWLSEHFTESFADWGYSYGLAAPRVQLPDGTRGLDWAVVSSQNTVWSSGGLLDYRAYSQYAYNPGGATLIRKSFWQAFPWNENLFWNEHEDVELCRRVQRAGGIIALAGATLMAAEDRWVDQNPEIPYCDQNEVLYGRPVGEQRIYFVPTKKAA